LADFCRPDFRQCISAESPRYQLHCPFHPPSFPTPQLCMLSQRKQFPESEGVYCIGGSDPSCDNPGFLSPGGFECGGPRQVSARLVNCDAALAKLRQQPAS
jgi:hypothetical protein